MRDSQWARSRLATLAFIIALHAGMIVVLMRLRNPPPTAVHEPVSLFFVTPEPMRNSHVTHSTRILPLDSHAGLMNITPLPTPGLNEPTTPETGPQPIDWARELDLAARSQGAAAVSTPGKAHAPAIVAPSVPAPPIHQRGDSSTSIDGETTVWLNDHCYQVSGSLLTVPDVFAHAMIPRTDCIRKSNEPRGDLFENLSAYKKLQPKERAP